jgi:hypothetical protein
MVAILVQILVTMIGMCVTSYFGVKISHEAGVSSSVLVPFTLGVWLVAWSPLIVVADRLKRIHTRLRRLEVSSTR